MVQVLTGHGCFGKYLHRIGRERTTACHHCDDPVDTAEHTLEVCTAWAPQRARLQAAIGLDITLPAMIKAMVGSKPGWDAVKAFCEAVIATKEAAEREREEDPSADPIRRKRVGQRRRAFARRL
ncbi:uncharacterized protein LOC135076667 [Ostrinia nubilalis]|uniref:uncharacterized protein LOC135076667 n=1 Tax=Ostrinia nubilalis TaxID=29057 RepID=UPI003082560D